MTEQFSNNAVTALAGGINENQIVINVVNASAFPKVGNFRIVVQSFDLATQVPISASEIMLVTAIDGNQFIVVRGYEGTTASSFDQWAQVAHIVTAGVMEEFQSSIQQSLLGQTGFYNYAEWIGGTIVPSDATSSLQNFLLYCQLQALAFKGTQLDDQIQTSPVNAYIPRLKANISCPLIVPEYVNLISDADFIRIGSIGTITNFYTGNTSSKALSNRIQPAIMIVPRGHCEKANIYCNSNGSDNGSGLFVGKNWVMYTPTLASGGKNYQVNDVLTFYQPSLSPYIAAQITVNSVNGSGTILTFTLSTAGAYALPPVLQQQQWTADNGFGGAFDVFGNLSVSGGNGTGASFAPNWLSDWGTQGAGGGNTYYGGNTLITDTIIGTIRVAQSSTYVDGTYGATFGLQVNSLNHSIDDIGSIGSAGAHGFNFINASDCRVNRLNPVDAATAGFITNCASVEISQHVIDTPSGKDSVLYIDNSSTIISIGTIFKRNMQNVSGTPPATVSLGNFPVGSPYNSNIKINHTSYNCGSGGNQSNISSIGCPYFSIAYTGGGSELIANINNRAPGYVGQYSVTTSFASFGSNVGDLTLGGSINMAFGSLLSGTVPSTAKMDIWDAEIALTPGTVTATIGGSATNGDIVTLTFTNSLFSSPYAWPRAVSFTVTTGLSTTQIAAGIVAAINADAIINTLCGIVATNASNVITIAQMGQDANSTVVSASVSGSATETVAFSNSGQISGSISGGKLVTGNIYDMVASGLPINGSQGTGFGKANAGSRYTNTAKGQLFINNNTAASPFWRPANGICTLAQAFPNATHTGDTNETNLAVVAIAGNILSANGGLRITHQWFYTNSANNKDMIIRVSTTSGDTGGGTIYYTDTQTTKASTRNQTIVQNANSFTSQRGWISNGAFGDSSGSAVTSNINTANTFYINFNVQNANAGDSSGLLLYTIEWLEP